MNRRRKETAIRRINGATVSEILSLFLSDITRMALPAILLGCGLAWYISEGWMEKFTEKAPLSLLLFPLCILAVLAVILAAVILNCYRAATENPAVNIKTE
jgi:putative ABC transport system permease protein